MLDIGLVNCRHTLCFPPRPCVLIVFQHDDDTSKLCRSAKDCKRIRYPTTYHEIFFEKDWARAHAIEVKHTTEASQDAGIFETCPPNNRFKPSLAPLFVARVNETAEMKAYTGTNAW